MVRALRFRLGMLLLLMPSLAAASEYASSALYRLALGAVGLAYLNDSTSEQNLELGSHPPATRMLATSSRASCPLPVGQQVKAVKAFREMMPVFRHPRCENCHGAFDIFSERHPGAEVLDTDLDFRVPMSREVRETDFADQCKTCHSELKTKAGDPGWVTSPPPMFFVNEDGTRKSDEQLCMQMKEQETTGASFVSHIKDDHEGTQFIEAAFIGERALDSSVRKVERITIVKPPGNHAALTEKARKWVNTLGNGYTASPECGCVMPKIKLKIDHTIVLEVPNGLPSKEESHVKFELNLEPTGDPRINMFAGEHTLNREIRMTLPKACKGKATRRERWVVYALVDSAGSMKVRHTAFDDEPTGEIVCNHGRGTARMGIFPGHVSLVNWEAVMPSDSGSSKTLEAKAAGQREALTLTVLEVPSER